MWGSAGVVTDCCPKTMVTGESMALVEAFVAWKKLGGMELERTDARYVHAFLILERELEKLRDER